MQCALIWCFVNINVHICSYVCAIFLCWLKKAHAYLRATKTFLCSPNKIYTTQILHILYFVYWIYLILRHMIWINLMILLVFWIDDRIVKLFGITLLDIDTERHFQNAFCAIFLKYLRQYNKLNRPSLFRARISSRRSYFSPDLSIVSHQILSNCNLNSSIPKKTDTEKILSHAMEKLSY